MIFSLLKRRKQGQDIEPLYGAMMTNALNRKLFLSGDIPDTFEGRFESVTLHAAIVLRRLKALPEPAQAVAQELVDRIFDGLDSAMREVGISDVGVPKRMKTFAQGFYGRLGAYTSALESDAPGDTVADALSRNVLEGKPAPAWLVDYVLDIASRFETLDLAAIVSGKLPQPAFGSELS